MKFFLHSLCLLPVLLCGSIIESGRMEEILPIAEKDAWILIDVDNTLIEASTHLGSAQWRSYIRNKAFLLGNEPFESELILDRFWLFVQHFIPVRLVDSDTLRVIQNLKDAHQIVMALTAREPLEVVYTKKQLDSVGLSLNNTVFAEKILLGDSLYEQGVLYCGDRSKSEALMAFFQETQSYPKKVIFVDDKLAQLQEVEAAMKKMGIEFIGIRFSGADARVKSFDPQIAELQFSRLPEIISDEDAEAILCGG